MRCEPEDWITAPATLKAARCLLAGKFRQSTTTRWCGRLLRRSLAPTPPAAALAITVPFDSSSLVPDLAPAASQAVQTACGLALLRELSSRPPPRPVLFCFTGADSFAFQGSRNMYMALSDVPATWTAEISEVPTAIVQIDVLQQLQRLLP